jgi:hypothetical protein
MTSPADCCVRVEEQAVATASTPRIAVSFRIPVFMSVSYSVADLGVAAKAQANYRLALRLLPVCALAYGAAGRHELGP